VKPTHAVLALAFCAAVITFAVGVAAVSFVDEGHAHQRIVMISLGAAAGILCLGAVFVSLAMRGKDAPESSAAAKSLAEQVGLLEHIIDHIPHAVFWKDREGIFLGCNQLFAKAMGFKKSFNLIGKSDSDLAATEEERAAFRKDDLEVMELKLSKANIEETHRLPDGSVATLLTSKVPLTDEKGHVVGVLGIFTDITERVKMVEQIEANAAHLRQIIDLVPHRIFAKDGKGRFILANETTALAHGVSVDEMIGRTHGELHGDSGEVERMHSDDQLVIETGQPVRISEEVFTTADGDARILETTKIPIADPATGEPAVLGVAVDLTDRKAMEAQLRKSEERFRVLCDAAPIGIFQMDVEGFCLYTNPKWQDITGLNTHQGAGDGWTRSIHPDDRERVVETRIDAMKSKKSYSHNFRFISPDGEVRYVVSRVSAVREASGQVVGYVGTVEQVEADSDRRV
jgi:PAS domain S-box-containing protein